MKGKIRILIMVVILAFLGYMAYAIIFNLKGKETLRERISTIPPFRFDRLKNGFFTEKDLAENKYLIFLYFNSTCEFCQLEAKAIRKRIEEFKGIQLIFISTE
jgi:thioredoxin-related protein